MCRDKNHGITVIAVDGTRRGTVKERDEEKSLD